MSNIIISKLPHLSLTHTENYSNTYLLNPEAINMVGQL